MPARRRLTTRSSTFLLSTILVLGGASCSEDSGSVEALCEAVADVPPLANVVTGFAETHPAELSTRLDEADAAYEKLRSSAPDEIDDEVDKVIDLVDDVIEAVRDNPDDRDAAADRIRQAVADHPEVEQASAALVAYTSENCDIELDPTPTDEPTPVSDTTSED